MVKQAQRRGRKTHELHAWMNGQRVGTWTVRTNKPQQFQYAAEWIASPAARFLSLSLPFQPANQPHEGPYVENFFDNLLPDNKEIRQRLQGKFATASSQAFDLLREIGRDCVGAIQLLPDGETPDGWDRITSVPLTGHQVEKALKETVTAIHGAQDGGEFRISIAGAQEKTALLWHEGQWHRPTGATPTTHIFKLPLGLVGNGRIDMKTSVENEWLCANIMAAYGMDVAQCEIGIFGEEKALIVARFDRKKAEDGNYWLRLPQEDMCQASGTPPFLKYESDGGPGMKRILEMLRGSSLADQDRHAFFKAQILFWLLAAIDGHAKNFSIFHEAGNAYRMTPLYDVLSAWPVVGAGQGQISLHNLKMAMAWRTKNPHYRHHEIQRRHFNQVAASLGIGKDAEPILDEIVMATPGVIEKVESMLPKDFPRKVSDSIFEGIRQSAESLRRQQKQA